MIIDLRDPQLSRGFQNPIMLDGELPRGIFHLQRRNRMHLVCSLNGVDGGFRESKVSNFALTEKGSKEY